MSTERADPIAQLLKAPGTAGRIAALVLAGVALVLPAIRAQAEWVTTTPSTSMAVELAWLLPVAIALALAVSAITPIARYTRLVDLAAAAVGGILSGLLVDYYFRASKDIEMSRKMLQGFNPDGVWSVNPDLGAGALVLATVVMIIVVVQGQPAKPL